MDAAIDITATDVLKKGTLPKTGGAYQIVRLTAAHIDAITALHKAVHENLPEEKKCFLASKDSATFQQHLDRGNVILGCMHEGQLIAQSMITLPEAGQPHELMNDMISPPQPENAAVLGGMVVHPDYRGNQLQNAMLEVRITLAFALGRDDIISSADVGNVTSWRNLLEKGLEINTIGARKDGTLRYIFWGKAEALLAAQHYDNEAHLLARAL